MSAAQLKAQYRRALKQSVTIRRYAGEGDNYTDYEARGNARLYSADELIGNITQGDQRVIVYADDLVEAGLTLPLKTTDKTVVDGFEREIKAYGERKAKTGELIAYEIQARG